MNKLIISLFTLAAISTSGFAAIKKHDTHNFIKRMHVVQTEQSVFTGYFYQNNYRGTNTRRLQEKNGDPQAY